MNRFRWLIVWAVQLGAMFAASALLSASLWLSHALYAVCMWGLLPVLGLLASYRATVKGLLNYAAWIAPPLCLALGHMAVWFYPPAVGPVLMSAFLALVGAAAGEVRLRERRDTRMR